MCLVESVRKHFSIFSMVSQLWIIVTKILMTFVRFYSSLLASSIISVNSFVMNLFINLIFGLFAKGFCKFIFWLGFSTSLYRVIKYILDTCKCQHTLTFDLLFFLNVLNSRKFQNFSNTNSIIKNFDLSNVLGEATIRCSMVFAVIRLFSTSFILIDIGWPLT